MRVLVTGAGGLLGQAVQQVANTSQSLSHDFVFAVRGDADLENYDEALALLRKTRPDVVFHAAALVGGVGGNLRSPHRYLSKNMTINHNVIQAALETGVDRILSFLSTCVFPDKADYPLTSSQLHMGEPNHSNFGYAFAKRILEVELRAAREECGLSFDLVTFSNLYGPGDNFDANNGHVIPSLIHKFFLANEMGSSPEVWGDGSALREFTFSEDAATFTVEILKRKPTNSSLIFSNPKEVSIRHAAEVIQELLGSTLPIKYLTDRPAGQFRKPSSQDDLQRLGIDIAFTELEVGVRKTFEWFSANYPNVRGAGKGSNIE